MRKGNSKNKKAIVKFSVYSSVLPAFADTYINANTMPVSKPRKMGFFRCFVKIIGYFCKKRQDILQNKNRKRCIFFGYIVSCMLKNILFGKYIKYK